ncbi:DUF1272 domain-containing protein [Ramlibacter humi]|uniref:DUF1272 domain-containing protein n=1 Tax=Ramlibacter humi TaxID=2530451 RepID=A0A4Z0CAP8_9BURK|nr:DUF1272 domain-containing protein [Ramlibacter humi]TFZ07982.1 DUF1272 domain-containing protein [Ramlibacter humi]
MLELRPSCEHCDKPLPPASAEARICSFECTFCADCVDQVLRGACPNCGGGFVPRPIRPSKRWVGHAWLGERPAGTRKHHQPVDPQVHAALLAELGDLPPEKR